MPSRLRHWSRHILARLPAVLPSACALCGGHGTQTLCNGCRAWHFVQQRQRCARCALPLSVAADKICGECLKHPPAYDATIAAADYAAPVDQLVLALKFGGRLELAPLFARMAKEAVQHRPPQELPTLLTAVPLGPQRLAERGFNQALEIARPLSRALGARLEAKLVMRIRDTRAQALLHPDERRKNVRKAFLVNSDALDRLRGQHVGVVDDVMTTGETLNELAATLKRFGAARVTNIVFSRTLK